jgi:hypothetical protein
LGLLDFLKPDPEAQARKAVQAQRDADARAQAQAALAYEMQRQAELGRMIQGGPLPVRMTERLTDARNHTTPWIATLTPSELMTVRTHGIRPISSIAATAWWHYGFSWTNGHSEGWSLALKRLKDEAIAAGANAVLDVKMRTVSLTVEDSMDFTLVGTAVYIEGMKRSRDPIVVTVPTLEFVKLLEADVVPVGIAVGAHYQWLGGWPAQVDLRWAGNMEFGPLTEFKQLVRDRAWIDLKWNARQQGNGVLAHVNFSQIFETEQGFLGRHIVVATVVDAGPAVRIHHDIQLVLDMHDGQSPLTGATAHHQSYEANENEGAI